MSKIHSFLQSACAGLFFCHNCPVLIAVAVRDRTEQAIPEYIQARQWHTCDVGVYHNEVRVLKAEQGGKSHFIKRLVDHDLPIELVGRCCKKPFGHDLLEDLWIDTIFAYQRKPFAHGFQGTAKYEIVGKLDGTGALGSGSAGKCVLPHQLKQWLTFSNRICGATGDNTDLPGCRRVRPTKYGRSHQNLLRFGMRRCQLLYDAGSMRSHAKVNGARC